MLSFILKYFNMFITDLEKKYVKRIYLVNELFIFILNIFTVNMRVLIPLFLSLQTWFWVRLDDQNLLSHTQTRRFFVLLVTCFLDENLMLKIERKIASSELTFRETRNAQAISEDFVQSKTF